jgi:riboflavin kinase/FMN adenylyltransferase
VNVYHDLDAFEAGETTIATIGTFDGLHHGHRRIIEALKRQALIQEGEAVVVTFHPHPRLVLQGPDTDLKLLQTRAEKMQRLEELGVDKVLVIQFTKEFSNWHYTEFINRILLQTLDIDHLIIGYDHRFGANREGGLEELIAAGKEHGFVVDEISPQQIDEIKVSSTKIRNALLAGEVAKAGRLLGYLYPLTSTVVEGDRLGQTIGWPTANLTADGLEHKLIPSNGVYAVFAWIDGERHLAMMNIGVRPTVTGSDELRLEVHVLDYSGDLYGTSLTVEFVDWIRGEEKFDGLEALKAQLGHDEASARAILAAHLE